MSTGGRSAVKVTISANYQRWIDGFGRLPEEMVEQGRREWQAVTDVMFDRSQQYAHVLSGDNKRSGEAETVVEDGDLVGRIVYDMPYSIFEEMRGGDHAYLSRAFEATEAQFRQALPEAWEKVVASWS